MPIKDLQRRLTQVGVIRLGEQRTAKSGKSYPAKLDTLRFTSPSQTLIEAVAGMYGGDPRPWQANAGPQWEVITTVREIPVMVPPQQIDPNYELWGNGFRARLCDGETEQLRNKECMCSPDSRECKPTTRMSLMLAEIPSLGTWKLESHGWNAAAELPMLAESIAAAPQPIPARLEVQARQKKILRPHLPPDKQIETRNYMVPVLHFDFVTPVQAFGGQIDTAARSALAGVNHERRAIAAVPADGQEDRLSPADVVRLARHTANLAQLQQLWKDAAKDGALTDDVKKVLEARAKDLQSAGTKPGAQPPKTVPVEVVEVAEPDAEEPDPDATWLLIQEAAAGKGWNMNEVEQRIQARYGKDSGDINGWQMQDFLTAVGRGDVQ